MKVTLPDGTPLELPDGATGADAAAAIGPGLARAALAVKQDGEVRDLARPLLADDAARDHHGPQRPGRARPHPPRRRARARRGGARALSRREDLDRPADRRRASTTTSSSPRASSLSDADFERIEARMREHVQADEPFVREDVPVAEALERFRAEGQDYKVELIEDLVARPGRRDRQPLHERPVHRPLPRPARARATKRIKAFKLQSVAGAYWRGDASRQMLTRIYGTAFFKPRTSRRTSSASRRRARATTASSAASWGCSRSRDAVARLAVLAAATARRSATSSSTL